MLPDGIHHPAGHVRTEGFGVIRTVILQTMRRTFAGADAQTERRTSEILGRIPEVLLFLKLKRTLNG